MRVVRLGSVSADTESECRLAGGGRERAAGPGPGPGPGRERGQERRSGGGGGGGLSGNNANDSPGKFIFISLLTFDFFKDLFLLYYLYICFLCNDLSVFSCIDYSLIILVSNFGFLIYANKIYLK